MYAMWEEVLHGAHAQGERHAILLKGDLVVYQISHIL